MKLRLAELMTKHNISQAQLAQAIGIARPTVNSWLAGQIKKGQRIVVFPSYPALERLCHFFRCSPNDMLELAPAADDAPTVGAMAAPRGQERTGAPS